MAMTLEELLRSDDEDDVLEFLLTELAAGNFPVTDYEDGGPALTFLRTLARGIAQHVPVVADVAAGGLLEKAAGLSNGAWLTLLAKSWFELDRVSSVFARPRFRLTCVGAGPYTITPGMVWVSADASGRLYNSANTTNQTLPSGGTLDLDFLAESPGAAYNLALGAALTMVTALLGVTVATVDVGGGTPMVTPGSDEESNAALLTRCRARWATIGLQKTDEAYVFLATNTPGVASVTKVLVDATNPRGPNTVDIYLAGAAGGTSPGPDLTAVDAYLQARKGLSANLLVAGATNDALNVAATVYCAAAQVAAAKVKLAELLTAYQAALAIGDGAGAGTVYLTQLIELLQTPDGVRNVTMTLPATDYAPAKGHIAQLAYVIDVTITFVAV